MARACKSQEEIAKEAINHALKALRKRHLIEEAAHAPAFLALSRPIISQGSEWKEKEENLQVELQQCYKAQSRLSEQLVEEVAESRASKALVQEKENAIVDLQKELTELREECSQLKMDLEEKIKGLEVIVSENSELKAQLEQMTAKANNAEAENKMLIDRWMLEKMKDAERLNEANALYEDMVERLKASGLEQLARQQVDGIVRRSEESKLITGGQDRSVKVWDTNTGSAGFRHTLTGHTDKVCAVDVSKQLQCSMLQHGWTDHISGHVDGNLRLWDIQTGKLLSEVAAHSLAVTSISLSRNGNVVLTSGRDNLHNLFDVRSLEVCGTFRATGNKVASNWSRSCISPDSNHIAAGSADGSVYIWSISKGEIVSTLKEHASSVLCCGWSGIGKPLASADKNGIVCIWT
ncbi:WD40/YVTN repeat-like-containing domain superfamily [Sesbania bispinosa]|nr:WD40/YVTN repeat-like-containing domain superfamily [Sesbania bispinosa]